MKSIIFAFFGFFSLISISAQEKPMSSNVQFVYVKIFEQIMPIDRGTKYEEPLDVFLKAEKVGEVSGGGTMQSKPDKDGNRTIEYVGIDVDLSDFQKGMPVLKAELIKLGVPAGTLLNYTRDNVVHSDPVK